MASEFLEGALAAYRQHPDVFGGGLGLPAPQHDPLTRARDLTAELLELVAGARAAVARLEAERDELRRQLSELRAEPEELAPRAGARSTPPAAGELRRALEPAVAARRRPRPNLTVLLGG